MIVDLCCGIGRFESPELVVSIDIDRKVKPTIIADVRALPLRKGLKPRLCHASPKCTYFSNQRLCRGEGLSPLGIAESLRLVAACFDAFDYLEPLMWTLENPVGLLRRIIPSQVETEYSAGDMPHKRTDFWTSDSRGLKRALIPQDVRQKILSVTNNTRISSKEKSLETI